MKLGKPRPLEAWDGAISRLLRKAEGGPDRSEAKLRLGILAQQDLLSGPESERLGRLFWPQSIDGELPVPDPEPFYASALLWLPRPEGVDVEQHLSEACFEVPETRVDLAGVEAIWAFTGSKMFPTPAQAVGLFDHLVGWRAREFDSPITKALVGIDEERKARAIAGALSNLITPSLAPADLTDDRATAVMAFLDEVRDPMALKALICFVDMLPERRTEIAERLRQGLFADKAEYVQGAAQALIAWIKLSTRTIPAIMAERLLIAVEARQWTGLYAVLQALRAFVVAGLLSGDQLDRLNGLLNELVEETSYVRIDPASIEAGVVSVVRLQCVRLARALVDAGAGGLGADSWLALAPKDPLPEVRHALEEEEN
ncbi:MAG TPA: hypothetical protein VG166_09865 [Caulobacteraceae bacterium]|nr:hypothetical protein [Caulobacteraceae bacterium]